MRRNTVVLLATLALSLVLSPACNEEDSGNGVGLTNEAPDTGDRNKASGKADAQAPIFRVWDSHSTVNYARRVFIKLSTSGISPVSVGVVYTTGSNYYYWGASSDPVWETAYGGYTGTDDAGTANFNVDFPVPDTMGSSGFIRYAAFAVDGNTGITHWDNNGGDDYYVFLTQSNSAVSSVQFEQQDGTVAVDIYSYNLGYEELFVRYSLDEWATSHDEQAEYIDQSGTWDHYRLIVATPEEAKELAVAVRLEWDESTIWANNSGHDYVFGLVPSDAAIITFTEGGSEVAGTLAPGGYFQVVYDRPAQCTGCKYGMCFRTIRAQFRFWDTDAFWAETMYQSTSNSNDGSFQPELMATEPVYIPLSAEKISMWFNHTAGYPDCSAWDSDQGNNYNFSL